MGCEIAEGSRNIEKEPYELLVGSIVNRDCLLGRPPDKVEEVGQICRLGEVIAGLALLTLLVAVWVFSRVNRRRSFLCLLGILSEADRT